MARWLFSWSVNRKIRVLAWAGVITVAVCHTNSPAQAAGLRWPEWPFGARRPQATKEWTPKRGPVFDFKALTSTPLNARVLKRSVQDGIVTEEVMFHSETDGRKSIDIFAYFSYPEGGRNLPAFVWIEGGLAPARTFRTVFGARRGYATLAIDFPQPGYRSTGDYPINLMMTVDENPRQSPIYHGAVALLKAVSFLESRKQVDADRIGMAGSSWGGFYTTLMVGVDPRLKVGSCMFGGGNLQMGNMWWDAYNRSARFESTFRDHWRKTLDPAWRLPRRETPLAWFTGTNDWFFWMPSVMKTYDMAGGPKHLSLLPNWDHALPPSVTEQTFIWLDAHLKERPDFTEVTPVEVEKRGNSLWAQWRYSAPREPRRRVKAAHLILSWGDAGNWHARYWKTLPARMEDGICEVRLPDGDMPFYISGSVVDEKGFVSSTPLQRVEPRRYQIEYSYTPLNYDGCSDWGNFEMEQLPYLKRHKWSPRLTRNAAIGGHAVVLEPGETRLPMLHFTQGVPHRFTCWMRIPAETAFAPTAPVVVQFNAGFNGKAQPDVHRIEVGTEWTRVELEVTPHEDLTQRHNASIDVPEGVEVLLDRVRFRPLPDPWSDADPLPPTINSAVLVAQNRNAPRGLRVLGRASTGASANAGSHTSARFNAATARPRAVAPVVEPRYALKPAPGLYLARRVP